MAEIAWMPNPDQVTTWLSPPWVSARDWQSSDLGEEIGAGSGGRVWGLEGGRVLKVARPGLEAALVREALGLFWAGGAGTPRLLGVGSHLGQPALVMERVRGTLLLESTSEPARLALGLLATVSRALLDLGRAGFGHGDVKPENLLVTAEGRIVLIDLGLCAPLSEVPAGATPAYLDPALATASGSARDLFALALTAAELLDPSLRGDPNPLRAAHVRFEPPFDELLQPILGQPPARRPDLAWLGRKVQPRSREDAPAEWWQEPRLRAAYLQVRREEIQALIGSKERIRVETSGAAGELLDQFREVLEWSSSYVPAEPSLGGGATTVGESSAYQRWRLQALVLGPHAAQFDLGAATDQELLSELSTLTRSSTFGCVPWAHLTAKIPAPKLERALTDPVLCALALQETPVDESTLGAIEALSERPLELTLATARVLCRRGEDFRALALLARSLTHPSARLLSAEIERRRGHWPAAEELLSSLGSSVTVPAGARPLDDALTPEQEEWKRALLARRHTDSGEYDRALSLSSGELRTSFGAEVRALTLVLLGRFDEAAREVDRGSFFAEDDEQRARIEGVRGFLHHQAGRAVEALDAFAKAADHARRSGALLEEATYATGLAAAASDAGELGRSIVAAERAELLFEALGRAGGAARAVLAQASVLALVGDRSGLVDRVQRGLHLARTSGDVRCQAYLDLCLVDAGPESTASEAALEAARLLAAGSSGDRLRAAARLLSLGHTPGLEGDSLEAEVSELEPRIDWWRARAVLLLRQRPAERSDSEVDWVLGRLTALSAGSPLPILLGPALDEARKLALSSGKVDVARAFQARARELAARVEAGAGPAFSVRVAELDWVQNARSVSGETFDPAQLADVEALLRTFNQRAGLLDVLRHALDLLLLWTGVERGLILLVAPEGRLSVRAARNLRREDLTPEQLELSRSMAARAVREGRTVVAVDASRDLGELQRSVHALKLRSILAVPLAAQGRVLGVAYLDDRLRTGAFGPRELSFAQLIGTLTALAVSEERDRLQLRRALRRARRAEEKLATELLETRGELELASRQLSEAHRSVHLRGDYSEIVGRSRAMMRILQQVDRIAQSDVVVLITGESGTGKELIARAIVKTGPRKSRPFLAENCSAVPEALLESTLFGHRRGAFTGASRDQAGLFELADGGTLFLDEMGEMSLAMQAKLLRVLEDGEVRAIGSSKPRKVDVRVIAATHRDLASMVAKGTFREDLYYRLNVVPLALPPLRERPEDIDALLDHFVHLHDPSQERAISRGIRERFRAYSWPGNVRQLENEVRRMLLLGGQELTLADVSPALREDSAVPGSATLREKLDSFERSLLLEALEQHRGNRTRAAQALGVSRFGLQKMMQRLSIDWGPGASA